MTSKALKRAGASSLRKHSLFPYVNGIGMILLMFFTLYPVINTVAISLNEGTDAIR